MRVCAACGKELADPRTSAKYCVPCRPYGPGYQAGRRKERERKLREWERAVMRKVRDYPGPGAREG